MSFSEKRRDFLKKAGLLGAGALVAGPAVSPAFAQQKPKKVKDEIKIGHIAIFSGPFGTYGELQKRGSELAAEEINKAGGIAGGKVKVIYKDSAANPGEAIKQARRLVQSEGCDFIMGIDSSGVALGVADVMPELNKLIFVTHGATHQLTEKNVYEKGNKHVFRLSSPVYQDGIMAAILAARLPATKWAGVHPDYAYGYDSWDLFKKTLKKLRPDVEFVGEAWASIGTTDFKPHISSIMNKKPDGIHTVEWGVDLFTFVRQALQMGLFNTIKYKDGYAWINPMGSSIDAMEALGKEYPEGCWISGRYVWQYPPTPMNQQFVKAHYKKYNQFPAYSGATSYTAVYLIKRLIELSGTMDVDTHIKMLENMPLYTVMGSTYLRKEDHQAVYDVPYGQITRHKDYPIPVLSNLVSAPAQMYYPYPPFTETPPFGGYPPFVKV